MFLEVEMIAVKFSTLGGGVYIEQTSKAEYKAANRCFRFDAKGNAEYAQYGELVASGDRARFWGHVYKLSDFVIC